MGGRTVSPSNIHASVLLLWITLREVRLYTTIGTEEGNVSSAQLRRLSNCLCAAPFSVCEIYETDFQESLNDTNSAVGSTHSVSPFKEPSLIKESPLSSHHPIGGRKAYIPYANALLCLLDTCKEMDFAGGL